jgi:hypothetical protein
MKTPSRRLLGLAACAAALTTPAVAHAETAVDTLAGWDTAGEIPFFSPLGITAIGQTVTAPAGEDKLSGFTFQLSEVDDPPTMIVRPAVYAWDGTAPTGPALWQGPPTMLSHGGGVTGVSCAPGACTWEPVSFDTGDIPVAPGQQLILLLTTLFDTSSGFYSWGVTPDTAYAGGTEVVALAPDLAHLTDPTLWGPLGEDTAFRAVFGADRASGLRQPFVTALSAASGSSTGGDRVVIRGENFTTDSKVLFGDVPAASVTVDRFDEIVAVTPPHDAGGFDVRVVTPRGQSPIVDADAYTFVDPPAPATTAPAAAPKAAPQAAAKPKPKPKPKKPRPARKRRP